MKLIRLILDFTYSSSVSSGIFSGIAVSPAFLQLTTLPSQEHLAGQVALGFGAAHLTRPGTEASEKYDNEKWENKPDSKS